MKELRDMVIS